MSRCSRSRISTLSLLDTSRGSLLEDQQHTFIPPPSSLVIDLTSLQSPIPSAKLNRQSPQNSHPSISSSNRNRISHSHFQPRFHPTILQVSPAQFHSFRMRPQLPYDSLFWQSYRLASIRAEHEASSRKRL
jgi:hypothetical protein